MIKHEISDKNIGRIFFEKSIRSELKGLVSGYVFMIICFAILALIYTYTSVSAGILKPAVTAISAISIILAAFVAAIGAGTFGWIHGAIAGAVFSLIKIIAGFVFDGGIVSSVPNIIAMLLSAVALGAFGGILGINVSKA